MALWVVPSPSHPMSCAALEKRPAQQVGRYTICDQLAAGGMATVHLARLVGSAGFSRVVAAKRMHRHFLSDPEFKKMFLAEAHLAARIQHPNVVPILDVLSLEDELIIFMDYVHGDSLHALMRAASDADEPIPVHIGCAIVVAALHGLHAAHEALGEGGRPLGIVHRDVSPQNILVGADGVARVLDFGIAKALRDQNQTEPGTLKGKFSYMAPEAVNGTAITRKTDVFSAGVVLWELLTGHKLFGGATEQARLLGIIGGKYPSPRQFNPRVSEALEHVVAGALRVDPMHRYATALQFAIALELATSIASQHVVGEWVQRVAAKTLHQRMVRIQEIQSSVANPPARLSLPPTPSVRIPVSRDSKSQSSPTVASTPYALRRDGSRRWAIMAVGFPVAIALGIFQWLRQETVKSEHPQTQDSAGAPVAKVVPSPSVVPSANQANSGTVPAVQASSSPPQPRLRTDFARASPSRKKSAPPAVSLPSPRGKPTAHAKPYLPSEL